VFGAKAAASFSNSAFVMTVLQSAEVPFEAAAGFVVAPFAAAAVLAGAEQTPLIVNTAAVAGTEADVSAAGFASFSASACAGCDGGGALGAACHQANAPKKTQSSQLLRITHILQDWSTKKGENAKQEILAQSMGRTALENTAGSQFIIY